jgi:hypothetical protein
MRGRAPVRAAARSLWSLAIVIAVYSAARGVCARVRAGVRSALLSSWFFLCVLPCAEPRAGARSA